MLLDALGVALERLVHLVDSEDQFGREDVLGDQVRELHGHVHLVEVQEPYRVLLQQDLPHGALQLGRHRWHVRRQEPRQRLQEPIGERVLLVRLFHLEQKGHCAPMALIDQHTVTNSFDKNLRREYFSVGEVPGLEGRAYQEARRFWRGLNAQRFLVDLTEGRHT